MAWLITRETTNSGKQIFQCQRCGQKDPAPTKHHACDECERICGEAGKRDMHRSAPEICPILLAQWKNPKLVPRPRWEDGRPA